MENRIKQILNKKVHDRTLSEYIEALSFMENSTVTPSDKQKITRLKSQALEHMKELNRSIKAQNNTLSTAALDDILLNAPRFIEAFGYENGAINPIAFAFKETLAKTDIAAKRAKVVEAQKSKAERSSKLKSFWQENGEAISTAALAVVMGSSMVGAISYGMGAAAAESVTAAGVTLGGVAASAITAGAFFKVKNFVNNAWNNLQEKRENKKNNEKAKTISKLRTKVKNRQKMNNLKERISNIDTDALGMGAFVLGMTGLCCYGAGATVLGAVAAPLCIAGATAVSYGIVKAAPKVLRAIGKVGKKIGSLFKTRDKSENKQVQPVRKVVLTKDVEISKSTTPQENLERLKKQLEANTTVTEYGNHYESSSSTGNAGIVYVTAKKRTGSSR